MSPTPSEILGGTLFQPDTLSKPDPLRQAIDAASVWIEEQFAVAARAHKNAGTLAVDAFPAGLIVELEGQTGVTLRPKCLHPVYGQPDLHSRSRLATLHTAASINYSRLFPLHPFEDPNTHKLIGYETPWTSNPRTNIIPTALPNRLRWLPPGPHFVAEIHNHISFAPLLGEIVTSLTPHEPSTDPNQSLRRQLATWEMLQFAVANTALIPPPRPTFK